MIAKNIKGKSFGGCVRYVISSAAELLEAEGVFADSAQSVIRGFQMQRSQRSEIKQPVGHIPIAFSPEDSHRMTNEFMLQLAKEYMQEMGIDNTQYIIVCHHNTEHPHLHIVYNRIDNDLKLISVNNDYKRNIAVCKKLKDRHELTYGTGKENVNREKLHGKDEVKYEIYDAMREVIPKSHDLTELSDNLKLYGIKFYIKYRRDSDIIEGVSFQKGDYKFKGSEIDRKFSYAGLHRMFKALHYIEEQRREELRKNPPTPTVKGVKLTGEQWSKLESGELVWIENMQRKSGNGTFSAYGKLSEDGKILSFSKTATPVSAPSIPQSPTPTHTSSTSQQQASPSLADAVTDTLKTAGNVAAGIASALGGAIDTTTTDSDYNPDEAEAARQERLKKKKKRVIRM